SARTSSAAVSTSWSPSSVSNASACAAGRSSTRSTGAWARPRSSPRWSNAPASCLPRRVGGMAWNDWVRGAEVEPSIYAADFSRLGDDLGALLDAGAKIFQFDVGDGHFVEPITIGPIVLQAISPLFRER